MKQLDSFLRNSYRYGLDLVMLSHIVSSLPVAKIKTVTHVSLDMTTLTLMRILPREVDPLVYKMSLEDPGGASFIGIGCLGGAGSGIS